MYTTRNPYCRAPRSSAAVRHRTLLVLAGVMLMSSGAHAQTIVGYNITNARPSGYGGWSHSYNGTIAAVGGGLFNYTGGTVGTLNNGLVTSSVSENHLFEVQDNSVITLFLNGTYSLSSLLIRGGTANNSGIGQLTGATLAFGGGSAQMTSTPQNPSCQLGNFCDDFFDFSVSSLANRSGTTVTISNVTSAFAEYNIAEIVLVGSPTTTVPEPASFMLMAAGLGALGVVARRRSRR
jgi:hypothetical protein